MHTSTLAAVAALCASSLVDAAPPLPPPPPARPATPPPPAPYPSGSTLPVSSQSICSGTNYIKRGLVAFGTVAWNARGKFGDTLGGFGSAISPDLSRFSKSSNGSVSGTLYASPDRGWNTQGSIDYQGRVHQFQLTFSPTFGSVNNGSKNLALSYQDSTLLSKGGVPTTGLDADYVIASAGGYPDLPAGKRASGQLAPALDIEGLVRLRDGSYWMSDECGPYIYHFTKDGQMTSAIRPPISFIPFVDGVEIFTSGNPPVGSGLDEANDPDAGRVNNHGFEGLAISPDERILTAQIQAALVQDGGTHNTRANITRQVVYDVSDQRNPRLIHEWVVEQPAVNDPTETKNPRSLDVSDTHYLSQNQYFVLARDGGHGRGSRSDTPSTYRHIDIVSTQGASDIASEEGLAAIALAPNDYLLPHVKTTQYCSFLDINDNTDLARFGLQNGPPYATELNEKWESIAIVPVPAGVTGAGDHEFYIISVSDNDFITQDGYYNFGQTKYSDKSGLNVDTQILVWQAHLPNYESAHPGPK
ncbi:hypothetical protein LTR78_001151 [Recurvomyces mirabilis]|uniref:Phytase-like domain-containing protein n=1 Tax=Recurvomyces mirabilis TaxID=574656 RepID=A0AAE0WV20_9PEZI|nr:hypothetical protein LTR78_001151 [Recurvomyces mirabilis]KAK5161127.1 hypothetical protein LTS14_000923 [Recurvomyces mirabilis]